MKRFLGWMLVCLIILTGVSFGTGLAATQDAAKPASDIVIVLDHSKSMSGDLIKSDPDGYRLDAAELVVGMCDMEHSRVAYVPFGGTIMKDADTEFVSIQEADRRREKIGKIERYRNVNLIKNTDLGNALNAAVKLLLEREDKTNAPMIIALTDGQNDVTGERNEPYLPQTKVYVWDRASNTYNTKTVKEYGVNNDNAKVNNGEIINVSTQQDAAVEAAKYNQIPIYTLALMDTSPRAMTNARQNEIAHYTTALREIATETGGEYYELDATAADAMPTIFGKMFATQIGSQLQESFSPKPVDGKEGRYEVLLPILNRSVLEANIYVPLKNIRKGSLTLTDANGQNSTLGNSDVVYLECKNFVLYKIRQPRALGDWKLSFEMEDPAQLPSSVSLSLLYNYDITFKASVGTSLQDARNGANASLNINKNGRVFVTAAFYETDDQGNDIPSSDSELYKRKDDPNDPEDDWKTIRGSWALIDRYGSTVQEGSLISDELREYTGEIDLATIKQDADGYNTLYAGDYTLRIKAEGAGLHRINDIPITLINSAPQSRGSLTLFVDVNDPNNPETLQEQKDVPISASDVAVDPDNDRLSYEIKPVGDAENILRVRVATLPDGKPALTYDTVMDTTAGKVSSGTAVYTLTATDSPDQSTATMDVTFVVRDVGDGILSTYKCVTETDGLDGDKVKKNTPIRFSMYVEDQKGSRAGMDIVSKFIGNVEITNEKGEAITYIPMVLDESDPAAPRFVCEYDTGNIGGQYVATCRYLYGNNYAPDEVIPFEVSSSLPYVSEDLEKSFPTTITFNPLPGIAGMFEQPTPEEKRTVDLATFFTDNDNEKELTVNTPEVFIGSDKLTYTVDGDRITFVPVAPGTASLSFKAEDGDGLVGTFTRTVRVVDLTQKWIMIYVTVVALIAFIIIIYLVTRPRFQSGTVLEVRINETGAADYRTVKRTQEALSLGNLVDYEAIEAANINAAELKKVKIRPRRGNTGSVTLIPKDARLYMALNDSEVGRGSVVWSMDTELTIKSSFEEKNRLRITLTFDAERPISKRDKKTKNKRNINGGDDFMDVDIPETKSTSDNDMGW